MCAVQMSFCKEIVYILNFRKQTMPVVLLNPLIFCGWLLNVCLKQMTSSHWTWLCDSHSCQLQSEERNLEHWNQDYCHNVKHNMSINFRNDMVLLNKFSFSSKIFKSLKLISNVQFKKIFVTTPTEGIRFPRGKGVNLSNFPGDGEGRCTIGKYFQWVLVAHERVIKKKS